MKCPVCGFENPEEMKFCGQCGATLTVGCDRCGCANPLSFKYCGNCGRPLGDWESARTQAGDHEGVPEVEPSLAREEPAVAGSEEAERRQLTVMFCDLVGSTSLSVQLDPEDLRELLREYQTVCGQMISQFEGSIAQYLGDGILVYFGYPRAHEDDAHRAVRTALCIVQEMTRLDAHFQREFGVGLAVRIGIHTGLVVVGEMGRGDQRGPLALGSTPNFAARLQTFARPNGVAVSQATYRLIQGYFDCQSLGTRILDGIPRPVEVYHILQESGAHSRLEVAADLGLTPFVGREQEIAHLQRLWQQARSGEGQIALIRGDPGIGKSRLVQELKERLGEEPLTLVECHCSSYYQNSALHPVIETLQRVLEITTDHSPAKKLGRVEKLLASYDLHLHEVVPLFASLLSIPLDKRYEPAGLSPRQQKQKTQEALLAILKIEADRKPVLVFVDDLHWIDPSTFELLNRLFVLTPETRMLVVMTARPTFAPPASWSALSNLTTIEPGALDTPLAESMVRKIAGGKAMPPEVLDQVIEKTDGVPLFVEELTKMVLESGILIEGANRFELAGPIPPLAIPATLQDSLTARLDRLATVREVAQLAAALGRKFSYDLLHAVCSLDEATLQRDLAKLVEAGLIYPRPVAAGGRIDYVFRHALIQESAYESLLKSKRQQVHRLIAQKLAEQFPEEAERQPELLAHHYTEAGLAEQAIAYWRRAGQRAVERSANVEAIHHIRKGLSLLDALDNETQRAQKELELQLTLGTPLIAIKGYASAEVGQAYGRARELCLQLGETPQLFPALHGLYRYYLLRAELQTAIEIAGVLQGLAEAAQNQNLLVEAHRAQGVTLFHLGEVVDGLAHLDAGLAAYDFEQHRHHAFLYGTDPRVICLSYSSLALWLLGYPDQALARRHQASDMISRVSHPFSQAVVLNHAAWLHQLRQEVSETRRCADALIALSEEQGFPFWRATGEILQGWALANQGEGQEGVAQLQHGLAAFQATGANMVLPYFFSLLAEAYYWIGRFEQGLAAVDEALVTSHRNHERFFEAELNRLKGEHLLALSAENKDGAEECFKRARDIAGRQQARLLEWRAVRSWCRLLRQNGRQAEARQLLVEKYNWFTEGLDTADLKEARVLIEELS